MKDPNKQIRNLTEVVNNLYEQNNMSVEPQDAPQEQLNPLTEEQAKLLVETMMVLEGNKDIELEIEDLDRQIKWCTENPAACQPGSLERLKKRREDLRRQLVPDPPPDPRPSSTPSYSPGGGSPINPLKP